jgi:putative flippase GtrA
MWGMIPLIKSSDFPWRSRRRASNAENIRRRDASIMVKAAVIDVHEFARFVLSGVAATVGNMLTVWLTRYFLSFGIALLAGIAAAIAISLALSKFFSFRSRSWNRAAGEAVRFLIVYATGCAMYWMVAVFIRVFLLARGMAVEAAEPGGILVGAGTMTVTSYCGHRFFLLIEPISAVSNCAAQK